MLERHVLENSTKSALIAFIVGFQLKNTILKDQVEQLKIRNSDLHEEIVCMHKRCEIIDEKVTYYNNDGSVYKSIRIT